jgi:hypothetical protein
LLYLSAGKGHLTTALPTFPAREFAVPRFESSPGDGESPALNVDEMSKTFHNNYLCDHALACWPSQVGDGVMFPQTTLHAAPPHNGDDERVLLLGVLSPFTTKKRQDDEQMPRSVYTFYLDPHAEPSLLCAAMLAHDENSGRFDNPFGQLRSHLQNRFIKAGLRTSTGHWSAEVCSLLQSSGSSLRDQDAICSAASHPSRGAEEDVDLRSE